MTPYRASAWDESGVFTVRKEAMKKYQSFLHSLFYVYGKMTAQKHGYKSVPDSIAGLSESGANAEHTGKSCSRLELVVRECGLMLQGMVSVFLFCCHTSLRICRIRSHVPGPRDMGERNRKPVYRDSWLPVCQSCIPAGIFAIYMTDGNRILPWSFLISFSIHLYCISTPFSQPLLKILL